MSVQDAVKRTRVREHRAIEISELDVDGGQRRHGVPLAEHEHVLPATRGVPNVEPKESPVEERDERNRGRERATGVQALVDGIAALLEDELPDVRVLDRKKLQDPAADHVALPQQRVALRRSRRT